MYTDVQEGMEARPHNMISDFKIDGKPAARSKVKKITGLEFTSTMTNENISSFTTPSLGKVNDVVLDITSGSDSTAGGTIDLGSSVASDDFFDALDATSTGVKRGTTSVSSTGSNAHVGAQIEATGNSTGSFAGFEGDLYVFYTSIEG